MKVSIINCSTRTDGRTSKMLSHFISGMSKVQSADIKLYNIVEWTMHPCKGCSVCWLDTPGCCIMKDDFSENAMSIFNSDFVILATPIRAGSGTYLFKIFVERIYAVLEPYFKKIDGLYGHERLSNYTTSKIYLFSICALPGMHNFESLLSQLKALEYLCNFSFKGAILKDCALELKYASEEKINGLCKLLEDAGTDILQNESAFEQICKQIAEPLMDTDTYINMCNEFFKSKME